MLSGTMAADTDVLSVLLTQLDSIAKAPMTASERELRADSLLGENLDARYVASAMTRQDLAWNVAKAEEHRVTTDVWLHAVAAADIPASTSVGDLLERMHKADAIADMMRAGYEAMANWPAHAKG
jgi:hypothetical protein